MQYQLLADTRRAAFPMTTQIEMQIALVRHVAVRADHRHEALAAYLMQRLPKGLFLGLALPSRADFRRLAVLEFEGNDVESIGTLSRGCRGRTDTAGSPQSVDAG